MFRQLQSHLAAFRADQRGGTVLVFCLFVVSLTGVVGLTVDYGRASRLKVSMQDALDSGVLAVGSGKQAGGADGKSTLDAYISANWKQRHSVGALSSTFEELPNSVIKATATAPMPTTFMKVVGISNLDIKVESQGMFGIGKAEVALVLDTTGSMDGQKLDGLKKAAKDLVEKTYDKDGAEEKIKFSIVPFAQYVNVGTQHRGQSWLNVQQDGPAEVCKLEKPVTNKWGCSMRTGTWYDDGKPVSYTYEHCDGYDYGPEQNVCKTVDQKWNGCVGSRVAPLDQEVTLSSSQPIPGLMNVWCGSPMRRLSNSKSDLKHAIDDFVPSGETYMAPGLMWGWRAMSPTAPFNDAAPKTGINRARKVLVLMTDGVNTASASAPTHDGWDPAAANQTTRAVCQKIKDDGIEIYAIAFDVTDPTVLNVLQSCATSAVTHYFTAQNTTTLDAAFQRIGESLTKVRLKQ
jgi:Flp pilus assembly protein TadG